MARKKASDTDKTQVRVLRQIGEHKPDAVIELEGAELEALIADGAVDSDADAVAYALSLA